MSEASLKKGLAWFSSTTLDAGRFGEGGAMFSSTTLDAGRLYERRLGPSARSLVDYGGAMILYRLRWTLVDYLSGGLLRKIIGKN